MKCRRFLLFLLTLCLAFSLAACAPKPPEGQNAGGSESTGGDETDVEETMSADEIFLTVGNHKISVKLEKNAAANALAKLLAAGDIPYTAHEYGGFEKVGELGQTLPHSDVRMTTEAGDVILYMGNQIVLFYGSNTWSYTKLGKMQNISKEEIENILTETDPTDIILSLN